MATLVGFLKKYSKVDNEFIDDFFGMYSTENKYNFCIDVDVISKWLNIKKGHIKDTLISSYKKGTDYIIRRDTKKRVGAGQPRQIILLTPKCFKMMAMQGRSKRATEVREFYYELEQLMDRYKDYIIEGMQKKIDALQNNQKPRVNPESGVIYIIQTADGMGHYKVGKTTNLRKRLRAYNGDKKDDIIPLFVFETKDIDRIEACVRVFAKEYKYRKYKEVYKADLNFLKRLVGECAEFNDNVVLKQRWTRNSQDGGNYYIAMYRGKESQP